VQYQESSFGFVSRLMEQEGIYYFFRHEKDRHMLVLMDDAGQHSPFPGYETIPYHQTLSGGSTNGEGISQWTVRDVVTPGLYTHNDYDFRKPYAFLLEARQNSVSPQPGKIDVYDWPGKYVESAHGAGYAAIRQQQWQAEHEQIRATATAMGIAPGHVFALTNAARPGDNGSYMTLSADYDLQENRYVSGEEESHHSINFTVIPAKTQFRPAQQTPWPRTYGPQTARVVCPPVEEIWTDKYGRIKVQFHWDREAKGDDTSSCWVRVSSAWAGQGFGGVQIPRANDEVVVDFINGDPDRPIVIGRVYNDANMPPWSLPGGATRMGFFSRSKGGGKSTANILQFEDAASQESFYMQAQKDMTVLVKDNQSTTVNQGHQTQTIKLGNRTVTVQTGNDRKVVAQGKLEEDVALLRSTRANSVQVRAEAGKGGAGGTQFYQATDKIDLNVGGDAGSRIAMTADAIVLSKGDAKIVINGDGIALEGSVIHLNKDKE
jgi:type VI secretion system secreted protein VgrG